MVLYLSIVFGAVALISGLNIGLRDFAFENSAIWVILAVVMSTIIEIAIQGIIATIVKHLPDKWFAYDKKLFKISKKERNFYEKLKIRSWKDKVWELGGLGGFRKNKIADKNNPEYLLKFVVESNKGIVDHVVGIVLGFLVVLVLPLKYALSIGVPVALVNVILCTMPTMILRYNIPKIMVAYERSKRTKALEDKKNNKNSENKENININETSANNENSEIIIDNENNTTNEINETNANNENDKSNVNDANTQEENA